MIAAGWLLQPPESCAGQQPLHHTPSTCAKPSLTVEPQRPLVASGHPLSLSSEAPAIQGLACFYGYFNWNPAIPICSFSYYLLLFFFSQDFIYLRAREYKQGEGAEGEGEADSLLNEEPDMRFNPRTLRS